MQEVRYHGGYVPLQGITMSRSCETTVNLSFDVRGGLIIRQMHHWSALLFMAAIIVHMLRVFLNRDARSTPRPARSRAPLGQLLEQPVRAGQRQPPHLLLRRLLGRLLVHHIVQCRDHHGTFPTGLTDSCITWFKGWQ
jgi:hypothetical protein